MITQNTNGTVNVLMRDVTNHLGPIEGLTDITMKISKLGGPWQDTVRTITEIGEGVYKVSLTEADTDTVGEVSLMFSSPAADNSLVIVNVTPAAALTTEQQTMLLEMYNLLGLDPTKPLTVTKTSRSVTGIDQTIVSDADSTVVTRI